MDLSVEEANKIRVAMGLAPLPTPGGAPAAPAPGPSFKTGKQDPDEEPASTLETRSAASYDNWTKHQQEKEAQAKREAQKEAIKRARDKAQRFAKLEGKGIADIEEDVDDKTWLMQAKKRQKRIEKEQKLREEQEEARRKAEAAKTYTEADLAGVKVAHELDAFGEGEDQILVLKDTAVDADEEGDELEAVALREKEKLQEKLDSKKRKRAYDPNAMDENGETSILAQYDEEIEGKKRKVFTLDGQGKTVEAQETGEGGSSKPKKNALSLDILKDDTPVNDYMDISEIKVKKPKKKKSKSSRKRQTDDDEDMFAAVTDNAVQDPDAMEIEESKPVVKKVKVITEEDLVDDDDLQAKLAAQRKAALKKRKKQSPEELARRLREEASATPGEDVMDTVEQSEEPGLVIDETTEFVTNLNEAAATLQRPRPKSKSKTPARATGVDEEGDVSMVPFIAEQSVRSVSVEAHVPATGIDEEATLDGGLGQAVKLLRERGILEASGGDKLNESYRQHQRFLADKQKVEEAADRIAKEQRERDRQSGRFQHMTPRERELHNQRLNAQRDQAESRRLADIFNREYKPNVQLNYVDEHGRHLNEKEAFKLLSHQFHGKGSGNGKTQKHLERIEKEKKRIAESLLDSSGKVGMNNAQGVQSKKKGTAGVRLQ